MNESDRYVGTFEVRDGKVTNIVKSLVTECENDLTQHYIKHKDDTIDYPEDDHIHGCVRYFGWVMQDLLFLPIKDREIVKQLEPEFNLVIPIDDFITWKEYSAWR